MNMYIGQTRTVTFGYTVIAMYCMYVRTYIYVYTRVYIHIGTMHICKDM